MKLTTLILTTRPDHTWQITELTDGTRKVLRLRRVPVEADQQD